ncbi:hypothetical protein HPB47_008833 [Ixodes persulcatus]|uniref:Uncharacterized protein n=1 Tax=Ixodes persulcatus TaxID=34615 RepID=A0AC60P3L3_IXOPE|nr:hypothetical protein HPB47_008833 [Ixodes persulcatus]
MDFHAAKSALEHEELFPALEFTPADSSVTKELAAASGFKDIAGNKNEHSKKPTALATPYVSVLKATKPKAPTSQGVRQGSTSQGIQMSAVSETPPPETTQSDLQLSTVRQRRQVREADAKPSNSIRATPAVSVRAARHGGRNTHLTCPSILQWNARGLRRRLPDLRQHLIHSPADVLAIQEPMTRPGEFRFSPYVIHHSTPARKGGRSRAALLVTAGLAHNPVDLSSFTTEKAEFAAATIEVRGELFTIISAYVAPGRDNSWDAGDLNKIALKCPGHLMLCGDFNAHNSAWDDRRTTARGRSLECVTSSLHLEALNDGTETYVRRGVNDSVLDLSFAPPDAAANWTPQPDSWGSDHIPINIVSPNASKPKYRRCRVTNWDMYRRHLDSALAAGPLKDPIIAIANALSLSTRTIKVPLWRPAPDLVYLNLRAARRRAQRKARRTKDPKDWNTHHKIDAKFRRHTLRLQRKQWGQLCASFGSPGGLSKAWKIAKALSSAKQIQHPISGLAVALQKPLQETVELLADEFSKAIPLPPGYQEPETRPSDACAPMQLDNHFTRGELYALRKCTKRSAPGPDGVTYQALRNLDKSHHPALLEALNKVWRTTELPAVWKVSHVIPIPKPGKPHALLSSYRPISLTSCVGKLLERLVLRRLTWQLGTNKTLPDQLSGFRTHRSTVDAIGEVATSFEEARAAGKTMSCAFLDIHKAFDALPHATILHQLTLFGIAGRAYAYICAFLQNRTLIVNRSRRQTVKITLDGIEIARRRTHLYLGLLIDTSRHGGRHFPAYGQRGIPPDGLLTLYKGLLQSKLLYALPFVNIRRPQLDALERFHRVALRLCLGLPPYAKNVATLTEAQEEPIILREERVAMHSLVRMHTTPSAQYILANLLKRPSSHLGQLAAQFQRNIGSPGVLYSSCPPHSPRPPLDVRETLPDLPRKKDIHPTVARTAVAVALENEYVEHLEVYTDGSVDKKRGTATAAYTIPAISTESAVLLNIETSSTTEETVAILLALTALQERPAIGKAVILTDSRSALVHIANPEHAPLIAQEAAHLATKLEDNGWRLVFQWVPSHSGILGNERADTLATRAHSISTTTHNLRRFHEASHRTRSQEKTPRSQDSQWRRSCTGPNL